MKKVALIVMGLALACLATGCTDPKVTEVTEAINAIGEVTIDSEDEIASANDAYASLTDEQKKFYARAAQSCPVHNSLREDITYTVEIK